MRALKSLAAIAAVVAGLLVPVTASHATAVTTVSPATGSSTTGISLTTAAGCAGADANTYIQVFQTGPGFPEAGFSIRNKSKADLYVSGSGYVIPLGSNMQDAAAAQTPAATLGGKYTFTIKCFAGALTNTASETLGTADIWFTSATVYVSTDPAVSTSVGLAASRLSVSSDTSVTLTASLTPSNAVGSVEFFDGVTSLGTSAVSAGVATTSKTFSEDLQGRLTSHSITAVFTPTNALAFAASTSSSVTVKVVKTQTVDGSPAALPTDGTSSTAISVQTSATCPNADDATKYQVFMVGSGFPVDGINVTPKNSASSLPVSGSGYLIPLSANMAAFAAAQSPPATLDGEYVFTVKCFSGTHSTPTAVLGSASLWFTSPTVYQTTEPSHGTATSLQVAISPVGSVVTGQTVTFTATVTPTEAVGSVTFTATPVSGGGSPIVLGTGVVNSGEAAVTYSSLAGGASSGLPKSYHIDATFTPSSEAYFTSDAEQKTLVVLAKLTPANTVAPSMTAAKVGTMLTCSVGTWTDASTYTITIKVAGVTVKSGTGTSTTYTPVAANVGKQITCAVVARSVDSVTTNASAPAKTVAEGAALKVVSGKSPKITGTVKSGQKLTVSSGTWTPAAKTYSYQWVTIVGSKATAIARATSASYTIPASLKGKTIGVIVTAELPGYADGTVTITAGKVA